MARPLVHIGYHKTGTSWLQKLLFPRRDLGLCAPLTSDGVRNRLVRPHPLEFSAEETLSELKPMLEDPLAEGLVPVLSAERLSGNPHSGGYDSTIIADRLHTLFPDAGILIVVREQVDMIQSNYFQYVKEGGICSLRDWMEPTMMGEGRIPLFRLDHFKYDLLADYYVKLFGKERVLVLPFELFVADGVDFVARILAFMERTVDQEAIAELPFKRRVNTAISPLHLMVRRRLNPILVRDRLNLCALPIPMLSGVLRLTMTGVDALVPKGMHRAMKRRVKRRIQAAIGDRYAESNRHLAETFGLDLERFGYRL